MILTLFLDHACNLRCTYCYNGRKFSRPMPWAVAEGALRLAFEHASPRVQVLLFGGEPLLHPELVDSIALRTRALQREYDKSARLVLTTNGTLLDPARLDLLRRHDVALAVSLDGDPGAHDAARCFSDGRGSWSAASSGARRALATLRRVESIAVVHPGNVRRMAASFDALVGLGFRRLAFNLDYAAPWRPEDVAAYADGLAAVGERILVLLRAGRDTVVSPLHTKWVSRLKGGFGQQDRCAFGCGEVAVAPSGNLYPCDRLVGDDGPRQADVRIGSVANGIDWERVGALRAAKDQPRPDCEGCAIVDRCAWWCGCANRAATGSVDRVSGLQCATERAAVRVADALAAQLYAESNPLFLARYYTAAARATDGPARAEPSTAPAPGLRPAR